MSYDYDMQQFQRFIGRRVDFDRIGKTLHSASSSVTGRYLPDELDDFDEMEFGAGIWEEKEVIFTLVVENGKLARISLGYIPGGGSEDDMMAFTETQLEDVLAVKGEAIEGFFDSIFPE
jgi:hypothetical protein